MKKKFTKKKFSISDNCFPTLKSACLKQIPLGFLCWLAVHVQADGPAPAYDKFQTEQKWKKKKHT